MQIAVVRPGFEVIKNVSMDTAKFLELCGRVCYKSEARITDDSAEKFVRMLRKSGHESVLEHASATVKLIGSRSMSHQLVRHRLNSFSQESQRYCNYGKLGFQVICPPKIGVLPTTYYYDSQWPSIFWLNEALTAAADINILQHCWLKNRLNEYKEYLLFIESGGITPEDARECLPNATKTEVVMTCNLRQWRHVFEERALNKNAQWQIRGITQGILREFASRLPCVFEDQLEQLNNAGN